MAESELEQRLAQAGSAFIAAHERAALAIRQAADEGMAGEAIARVSGLSPETVALFLRASRGR